MMEKLHIDIFNDNGDLLDAFTTNLVPRVGDIIFTIDRTHEQNPNHTNPGGTDILKRSIVKRVEIAYCKYGYSLNESYIIPIISVFI